MKKICGFALFWMAIGMFIMMMLPNVIWGVILIILFLLVGYRLFAVVKKKNKEAVLCFFLKRKNNDIKNGSEFTDPLFPCHCFR